MLASPDYLFTPDLQSDFLAFLDLFDTPHARFPLHVPFRIRSLPFADAFQFLAVPLTSILLFLDRKLSFVSPPLPLLPVALTPFPSGHVRDIFLHRS